MTDAATREARRREAESAYFERVLDETAHIPGPLTLADVRDRAVLTVEEAAQVMGTSRQVAYREIRAGRWPSIGSPRAIRVPVPALRRMLGDLAE